MPFRILRFVETVDGATYTARTSIPKGARLMDIICQTTTAWTAATASLDIGDSDGADSLVNGVDVTSTFGNNDGGGNAGSGWPEGTYGGGSAGKLYPTGDIITAVITAGTPGGPTGITTAMLWFEPIGAGQLASVAT